jgi:hypothetical protein
MKKARFGRAAYHNQQPLNEQLPGRLAVAIYRSTWRTRRRRARESESAGRREIQNLARDFYAEFLNLRHDFFQFRKIKNDKWTAGVKARSFL